jgi:hypothetical protein
LTPAQAKQQLREVAYGMGPRAWVRSSPYTSMTASFLLGMALASDPDLRRTVLRLVRSLL